MKTKTIEGQEQINHWSDSWSDRIAYGLLLLFVAILFVISFLMGTLVK